MKRLIIKEHPNDYYINDIDDDFDGIIVVYQNNKCVGYISKDRYWKLYLSINKGSLISSLEEDLLKAIKYFIRNINNLTFKILEFDQLK